MACRCHQSGAYCQCLTSSTQCIEFSGTGDPYDPYMADAVLDDAETNLASSSPAGLAVLLPLLQQSPPAAGAQRTEALTLLNFDIGPLAFDKENYDQFGLWSAELAARFVITDPGMYAATAHVRYARKDAGGLRYIAIIANNNSRVDGGNTWGGSSSEDPPSGLGSLANALFLTTSGQGRLDEGDYLEAWLFQSTGTSLALELNVNPYTGSMNVCRLGAYA